MDKPAWDTDFIFTGQESIKISCHAGDQGAKAFCNLIGDQPLFYIDDSSDHDEDDLFLMDSSDMLPSDEEFLAKMKAKLESYDRSAKSLSSFPIDLPEDEFDKAIFANHKASSLEEVLVYGQKSALFKSYLDFLSENNIQIMASKDVETSLYNREKTIIFLNPALDCLTAISHLIGAMRTAWHHKNGLLINPLSFQPEEAILINRLLEADKDVMQTALLWDLKLAGEEDVWHSAMAGTNHDLCSAYAMEAMTDFRSIKNGLAARSVFEKWFLSGRCKNHDRAIIQIMMGGHTDIHIDNVKSSRVIAADVIASMGHRPDGKNYLAPITHMIMHDALYGEVRDRSNANFLWFVTFERRMNEMEQELQSDDNLNKNTEENNVVTLSHHDGLSQRHATQSKDTIASIFILDHFRAG